MNKAMCSCAVLVDRAPEDVWDYTQNWNNRSEWDFTVKAAKYLSTSQPISIDVTGHLKFKVTYKMSDRPRLTTLVMSDIDSFFIKGGGGSWKYEAQNGSTLWTQHNILILRDDFIGLIFRPLFELFLKMTTKRIMRRARLKLESKMPQGGSRG